MEGIELAANIEDPDIKLQCLTVLYALFDKFGDTASKSKFKEVFSITEIGKMIREDGIKEGIEEGIKTGIEKGKAEGKAEGKTELLINLLIKKFKKVPDEYISEIKKLPVGVIDIIAIEIFDINSLEDIKKYF